MNATVNVAITPSVFDYAGIVEPFQVGEELIEVYGKAGRHCGGPIQSQSAVGRKACCAC